MSREELLNDYLTRFPDTPTMTLAKMAVKEHPKMWTSLECCRSALRYRRGNNGSANLASLIEKKHTRKNGKAGFKFELPTSIADPMDDYQINANKTFFMNDAHVPYHDDIALNAALSYADDYEPDCIYMNGDMADFFGVSRWEKNPEERNLSRELQLWRQFLAHLRERFQKARIIMKIGNHEERWEKYLWNKCPELCGCEFISFESVLDLRKWGVEMVRGKQKARFGDHLYAIHGHELWGVANPVSPARGFQTKMGVCTIGGHHHRDSRHTVKSADGTMITCWSVGCLCDMSPEYATINQWSHGFATIEVDASGGFSVDNKRILNGKVV